MAITLLQNMKNIEKKIVKILWDNYNPQHYDVKTWYQFNMNNLDPSWM